MACKGRAPCLMQHIQMPHIQMLCEFACVLISGYRRVVVGRIKIENGAGFPPPLRLQHSLPLSLPFALALPLGLSLPPVPGGGSSANVCISCSAPAGTSKHSSISHHAAPAARSPSTILLQRAFACSSKGYVMEF